MSVLNTIKYNSIRYWPLWSAIIAFVLFFLFGYHLNELDKIMEKVTGTALTVSGTLLGFLLTIVTIINTVNTKRMQTIKTQDGYRLLQDYMSAAITLNLVSVTMCFVLPIMCSICNFILLYIVYSFEVFIIAYTWFSSIQFTHLFIYILNDDKKETSTN